MPRPKIRKPQIKPLEPIEPLEPRVLLSTTYYVSPTGSDSADGKSTVHPWKTIDRVNKVDLNAGDKVLFQGGKTFTASGAAGANLLANPGFESDLSSWSDTLSTPAANASASGSAGNYHGGKKALKLTGASGAARDQNITSKLKAGQTYLMSSWTKTTNPGAADRRVGITFYLGGQTIATFYSGFQSGVWHQTSWEFVAPIKFDKSIVWASKTKDNSTFYVDDVSVKPIPNVLVFDANDSGTSASPVTIGSYGSGRAIIDAKDGIGLWALNIAGFSIQNLIFTGTWNATTSTGTNAGVGIDIGNAQAGNTKLKFIRIDNVETRNFKWAGIQLSGLNGKSGFTDVRITNTTAHDNGDIGVLIEGEFSSTSTAYAHSNVYIGNVKAYNNTGIKDKGGNSGSGILVADTDGATIERSVSHDNGKFNNFSGGGPVGIWAYDANDIKIQYNESYANHTGTAHDGGGFDLDGGVTNSAIQYNYSHDNDGPGILLCTFTGAKKWGNNTIAYNISQNDARKNGYGAITFTGGAGLSNAIVEQNTIYLTKPSSGASAVRIKTAGSGLTISNNILQVAGGATLVDSDSSGTSAQFHGNDYWSTGGSFRIEWGSTVYSSLTTWRSKTKRETTGATATGKNVDPGLSNPGKAPTLNDANKLSTLTQYTLKSSSQLIDRSVVLAAPFIGYAKSGKDFFGRPITTRPDVGAAEYA